MSNLSRRLRKLEPRPDHQAYLKEVGLRLMRYGIETRHRVMKGTLPETAWNPDAEELYRRWTNDPDFDAIEREILANLMRADESGK